MTAKFHRKLRFVMKCYSISSVEGNFKFYYCTLMTKLSLRANYEDRYYRIAGVIDPHDVPSLVKQSTIINQPFCCSTFFKKSVIQLSVPYKYSLHFTTITNRQCRHHLKILCVQHDYRLQEIKTKEDLLPPVA
jgi:hypothetical protein